MEKNLGYNIRKIRELRGIKQEYMAHLLGIDKSTYSDIEAGKTEITKDSPRFEKIAEVLKTTAQAIEEFNEERAIYNVINDNHGTAVNNLAKCSQITIQNSSFEEFAKVLTEPYKQQLAEKDRELARLQKLVGEKDKRIHLLEAELRQK